MHYGRFFAMIATSTVVMFGLMYLNTYLVSHVFWSETRAYMALVMGATMAVIMLAFMLSMYTNRSLNIAIFAGSIVLFAGALWLVRSQVTVQDRSFMRAMIPHHSIAIMTSTRAELTDPRVRELADGIVFAQDKEIAEMRYLIADIDANGEASSGTEAAPAVLKSAEEALSSEVVGTVDPEFLTSDDIATVFPDGATCRFAYTGRSPAVLVTGEDADGPAALIKISGDLVRLAASDAGPDGGTFEASPMRAAIEPTDDDDLHDLIIGAGPEYEAGFRGLYACAS
ncbi:DUF305 domain-containing protein [Tropicimonas isoalkanivorans]|uniref:DUF305 domain-containing protein n=1 Tax=Tropicimonas isoalkanivorans TaxID=441112 RepID=A0A1I1HIR6_9RHOB|nr:DUF305 domain-containing protein [Tropicimonas isoalkanivorans]SFC23741.1 protein of unknown function [Tropicimonas isoalkanivorans]